MTEKKDRHDVDWESVEREYRAGIKSVRVIATEYEVSHVAIGKRAKKHKWPRDLSAKIRAAAQAQLVTSEVVTTSVTINNERAIIEANAAVQVAVVREHRAALSRARRITQRLMDDLEASIGNRDTLEAWILEACKPTAEDGKFDTKRYNAMMKAIALPEHIGSVESLSRTLKNLIGSERQAFGIDDTANATDEPFEDRLKRLFYSK
jgi:hypothetical protein